MIKFLLCKNSPQIFLSKTQQGKIFLVVLVMYVKTFMVSVGFFINLLLDVLVTILFKPIIKVEIEGVCIY